MTTTRIDARRTQPCLRASASRLCLCGLAAAAGFTAAPTLAAITPTGDVDPSPPVTGQGVIVGDDGTGGLTIDGGSEFSTGTTTNDQSVIIGNQATGNGTVTVDGTGSSLETLFLEVGVNGTALFTASNGASVSVVNDFSIRGDNTATITGLDTLFRAGDSIFLNGATAATLNIQDQAIFQIVPPSDDNRFFIGSDAGAKGVVNVTGGATLEFLSDGNSPFRTFVGYDENPSIDLEPETFGELNINTGGIVTLARTDVGSDGSNATGVINVDGVGSVLNIIYGVTGDTTAADLNLGHAGGTGTLNITGGATVNIADDLFVSLWTGSTGTINVTDGKLDIADGLYLGYRSDSSLTVGPNATIEAFRFIVASFDGTHADVTFQLTEDTSGNPLNGTIEVTDFSFRFGTSELILDLDPLATFEIGDTFVLVDYETRGANSVDPSLPQFFGNVGDDEIITFDGYQFLVDYNDDLGGGDLALTATVVPEPGSLALLGLGGVLIVRRRR